MYSHAELLFLSRISDLRLVVTVVCRSSVLAAKWTLGHRASTLLHLFAVSIFAHRNLDLLIK